MKAYPEPANKLETGMAWTGTKRNLTAIQLEVTRRVIAISQRLCEKQTEQQLNLIKTKRVVWSIPIHDSPVSVGMKLEEMLNTDGANKSSFIFR